MKTSPLPSISRATSARSEGKPRLSTPEICILAGGRSTRMGRDKSRLKLARRTLLGHIRETARQTGLALRVIRRDLRPGKGPLGGIHTGLMTTRHLSVLFLACDMPLITPLFIRWILNSFRKTGAAVFTSGRGRAGFPLILPASAKLQVGQQLRQRQLSLQALARKLHARCIRVPKKFFPLVLNINTPEEFAALKASAREFRGLVRRPAALHRARPKTRLLRGKTS